MIFFLPFIVSRSDGFKNKMESRYFSTFQPKPKVELSEKKFNINEEFLFLFSGFTDGEGNFSITLDRGYIRFRFKINLHIDDLEVLNIIKSKLNVGRIIVEENRNSCAFVVQSFSELNEVICPLFLTYPLHTSKILDF